MFYCFKALNLAQIQIPEGGQHNDRVTHVCSSERRPVQIRPSEVRRANVRCLEPCSRQVCHSEVRPIEVCLSEVHQSQVRPTEGRLAEKCPLEIRPTKLRPTEVRSMK